MSPQSWVKDVENYDLRYAITTARFEPTWVGDDDDDLMSIDLINSGCIICKIGYGIENSEATLDVITGSVALSPTEKKMATLRDLPSNAFAELLWNTLERPANSLVIGDKVPTIKAGADPTKSPVPGAEAVLFQLMYAQLGRPTNLEILYERPILKNASISVLEGVAREFARQSLLVPKLRRAEAEGMKTENRLHMRRPAVWIMTGGFYVLAIICLLLLWSTQPVARIPAVSASVAGHAAILANSPDAQAVLTGTGHLSEPTTINNLDFTIVTFAPYSSLRSGSVSAERSILIHLLSVNPFLVLFKALQHGQLGAVASNAATLIAPLLTIIVSGLWVPMDSRVFEQSTTASVDSWDLAWLADSTNDGGAGVNLNLIRHGGAVTPVTIWKDLVLPRISLPLNNTTQDNIWVGQYVDLLNSTAGQVSNECPSIGMFFGLVNNIQTAGRNLTALLCSQGINQVPVTINYQGDPALGAIKSLRVRGQPQALMNKTSGSHTLGYKLKGFMDSTLFSFARNDLEYQYDSFFNQMVTRPKGYSREDLVGPNNAYKLIRAVTLDYCEYMRHIIDRNLRSSNATSRTNFLSATDGNSATSSHTMTTGSYSADVTHLVIDGTSKLILQILFATMTGFTSEAQWLY
ncbi:hypothetical protein CEP54_007219 [Fusarium duplospermum]|uniref:Uncharacterized protein n=1 Tax=Fusarium duplospermum TaxID=1325734 RepID=A0A428Q2N8_9HYPO|nr:hypothetical protein CEP54_007219 [Fusarium duplospermum]